LSAAEINDSMRDLLIFIPFISSMVRVPAKSSRSVPSGKRFGTTHPTGNMGARPLFISNCKI
jgi:hypothetical protein